MMLMSWVEVLLTLLKKLCLLELDNKDCFYFSKVPKRAIYISHVVIKNCFYQYKVFTHHATVATINNFGAKFILATIASNNIVATTFQSTKCQKWKMLCCWMIFFVKILSLEFLKQQALLLPNLLIEGQNLNVHNVMMK